MEAWNNPIKVRDLFAGSGWGVACEQLGWDEHGVEIMPEAQATRAAAGYKTVASDVRTLEPVRDEYEALRAFRAVTDARLAWHPAEVNTRG